jgi:hypothetical protein
VRLEGLGQLKNPTTSSGIEATTFRLVAQFLNKLRYGVPQVQVCEGKKTPEGSYTTARFKLTNEMGTVRAIRMGRCQCAANSMRTIYQKEIEIKRGK